MPDTGSSETETGSTTLISPPASTPAVVGAVVDRLTPTDSPESRIEAWHAHVAENEQELHEEMLHARQVLHTGTATDAIELANEDVARRASAAAARWPTAAEPVTGA